MFVTTAIVAAMILAAISTSNVTAQAAEPQLPNPDQIRQQYREASANWRKTPMVVLQAFVAAEDAYFFERPVGRSTITVLVGRWYVFPEVGRRQHFALARVIGEELSHEEVLDWYVNQVSLGQKCYGVSGAALAYFGKDISDLRLDEAAYLAALAKGPVTFHPLRSYERAVKRRNFVLMEMRRAEFISAEQVQHAFDYELTVIEPLGNCEED